MSKKRKQLTLADFYKKTPKQTEKEDQPSVAGGSTSDVGTTTKPREEAANVSSNINLTTNVNVTVGAKETEQDEPGIETFVCCFIAVLLIIMAL